MKRRRITRDLAAEAARVAVEQARPPIAGRKVKAAVVTDVDDPKIWSVVKAVLVAPPDTAFRGMKGPGLANARPGDGRAEFVGAMVRRGIKAETAVAWLNRISSSAVMCGHANECPNQCTCPPFCYCRVKGSCRDGHGWGPVDDQTT